MFVIVSPSGGFLFGNQTFTCNVRVARKFETTDAAKTHIRDTFINPGLYSILAVSKEQP
jgi:hypothetical protein